ncbi:transcriptional regulator GlxA family with amidase domain [Sphingomonas sp. UYAg733]
MPHESSGAKDIDASKSAMTHVVGFYLHPGYQLLDLAGPLDALAAANEAANAPLYGFSFLSCAGGIITGNAGTSVETTRAHLSTCGTLMVVGGDRKRMLAAADVSAVTDLALNTKRVSGVCNGAFLLAATGLLDMRRATTHWACALALQRAYPSITVQADKIFVVDGPIWTSAGITAGIDMTLAMIETDHGIELARAVARALVVYHRRPGGQSQFSALSQLEPTSDRIRLVLAYAREHLSDDLSVERLARAACLSPRQFGRVFQKETGETPARAVERLRVEAARLRLESSADPVQIIARATGFNDPERMRRAFVKLYGQSPQAIRRLGMMPTYAYM